MNHSRLSPNMAHALNTISVARSCEPIDALRQLDDADRPVSLDALRSITYGLLHAPHFSVDDLAREAGVTTDDVVSTIIRFGSWINRARGASGVDVVYAGGDQVQPTLLANATGVPSGLRKNVAKGYATGSGKTAAVAQLSGNQVLAHKSLAPAALGKDVTKALAEILAAQPGDGDVVRYFQRTSARQQALAFEHVTTVWMFARVGRLDELGMINPGSAELAQRLCDGYDILENARAQAMRSLLVLCADGTDPSDVAGLLVALRPVAQGLVRDLDKLVRCADSHHGRRAIERELRWLCRMVDSHESSLLIGRIEDLNQGQMLRIVQQAGIDTNRVTRVEESEVRAKLVRMGLHADADQLVTTGVRAMRAGLDDEFWDAVERRSEGDPDWDSRLLDALSVS